MSRSQKFTKENSLPYTVAEWYIMEIKERKQLLPHTVAEWCIRLIHGNLLKENGFPHVPLEWYQEFIIYVWWRVSVQKHCCKVHIIFY